MGVVIPLFRDEWGPKESDSGGWVVEDVISDEMVESMLGTVSDIHALWTADSEEALRQQVQFIKNTVATWPGVED